MSIAEPTVFIVDDDRAVRDSLQALVRSVGYATRTYASADAFLHAYDPDWPGCLVLDVRLRGMSGLDLQDALADRGCGIPIIVVSGHGDVPMAVRAMRAGAVDFIEKPYREQDLLDRIQQATELDAARRREHEHTSHIRRRLEALTPRENDVLAGVTAGKTNKRIAAELGISVRAIESHRARLMERLGVDTLADLVKLVIASRQDLDRSLPTP